MQPEADVWARHSSAIAEKLGVKFKSLQINALAGKGESPEEAARNARYGALRELIGEGDILLVGQHREDQLETVLLQLGNAGAVGFWKGYPVKAAAQYIETGNYRICPITPIKMGGRPQQLEKLL